MQAAELLKTRRSIREFLDTPVSEQTVRAILDAARWAPSGGNLQPWRVIAVSGEERERVTALALRVLSDDPDGEAHEYPVYPSPLWEPLRSRRYDLGEAMYALLGIPREDRNARLARFARNYQFFGAPVGLFFVIDRRLGHGQWAHLGMFMQSVALAALDHGLGTCMQEAWSAVRSSLGTHFGLSDNEVLYCGMSLGIPDFSQPVNQLRSERAAVEAFADFRGFR
jgi:nitroreductase